MVARNATPSLFPQYKAPVAVRLAVQLLLMVTLCAVKERTVLLGQAKVVELRMPPAPLPCVTQTACPTAIFGRPKKSVLVKLQSLFGQEMVGLVLAVVTSVTACPLALICVQFVAAPQALVVKYQAPLFSADEEPEVPLPPAGLE